VNTPNWENPLRPEVLSLALVVAFSLFLGVPQKRLRRFRLVAVPALLLAIGCGSTGSTTNSTPSGVGTPAGTYNLTVTGNAGSQTHTTNLTVVVN
jgi:hypothetical protein